MTNRIAPRTYIFGSQLLRWMLLCLILPCSQAFANLISNQAYFEDPTTQLSFAEVQNQNFEPFKGNLTKGYTSSAIWMRLQVNPASNSESVATEPILLRVRPPFLDSIELYAPGSSSALDVVGDYHLRTPEKLQLINNIFVLQPSQEPFIVYLKVTSSSSMIIGVDALPFYAMQNLENKQNYLNNFDLVLLFFLLAWGLILSYTRRDKIVTAFVIVQLVSILYATTYFGIFRNILDDRFEAIISTHIFSISIILYCSSYLLFFRRIIAEQSPPVWAMRVLLPFQFYPILGFGLMLFNENQIALKLNLIFTFCAFFWLNVITVLILVSGKKTHQSNSLPRMIALMSCWTLSVGLFFFTLPALGIIQATDLSLFRSIAQSLFSGLLLSGLIYIKAKFIEENRLKDLTTSSNEMRLERKRREEQSKFFSMLTHEIRTPLSVMSYATGTAMTRDDLSQYVERSIKEIDSIIERCSQAHELDQNSYQMQKKSIKLNDLVNTVLERSNHHGRIVLQFIPDVTIITDVTLANVILLNLFENALKYSQPNSAISVSINLQSSKDRCGLNFVVINKIGNFDFPDPERLYEKYYRSPTSHAATGSGLGLYLIKYFVEMLDGNISYEPYQEEVCFKLWLPI